MCALALAGFAPAGALARDCGGSIGAATDNVYRGISLTNDEPAWLVDAHCAFGRGWIAGAGATQVRLPGRSTNAQFSFYLDRRWQFDDDWGGKIGLVHYDAPAHAREDGLRYDEINATVGYRSFWRATVALSPNATDLYFGGKGKSHFTAWAETTFHQPIVERLAADVGFGISKPGGEGEKSYRYASAGLSYSVGDVYFYATHIWTDTLSWAYTFENVEYNATLPSHGRWVGAVVWSF
jgi:uncharacterized protein (TIGR02001 family)